MTPHTLFAPATSPAPFWCGPLETEHTVAATNVDELPLEDLLGRLAEATAAADACRREGTAAEGGFPAPFVADAFRVRPLRPVPAESPLQIRARVIGVAEGLTVIAGTVLAGGMPVAEATVVARRQSSPNAGAALRHLARIIHQTPAAAGDAPHSTVLSHLGVLDVLSVRLRAPRLEIPTAHSASPASRRSPVNGAG